MYIHICFSLLCFHKHIDYTWYDLENLLGGVQLALSGKTQNEKWHIDVCKSSFCILINYKTFLEANPEEILFHDFTKMVIYVSGIVMGNI